MLTIFALPKPFHGHIGVIQRNAIGSWVRLGSGIRVLLLGDDDGTAEAARELGVEHLPEIERNHLGTPRLDDAFARAEAASRTGVVAYVNADILLRRDFVEAVARAPAGPFLMVGRRCSVDVTEPIDFDRPGWSDDLTRLVAARGTLDSPFAMDYFVYRRGSLGRLPPFAVGRPGWDNWMIHDALRRGLPVIDATAALTVVHQNHGYGHVPRSTGQRWEGPEADENRRLLGGPEHALGVDHASHRQVGGRIEPNITPDVLRSRWSQTRYLHAHLTGAEPWVIGGIHERIPEGSWLLRRPILDVMFQLNELRPRLSPLWRRLRGLTRE